jgi:hypothetical protein
MYASHDFSISDMAFELFPSIRIVNRLLFDSIPEMILLFSIELVLTKHAEIINMMKIVDGHSSSGSDGKKTGKKTENFHFESIVNWI